MISEELISINSPFTKSGSNGVYTYVVASLNRNLSVSAKLTNTINGNVTSSNAFEVNLPSLNTPSIKCTNYTTNNNHQNVFLSNGKDLKFEVNSSFQFQPDVTYTWEIQTNGGSFTPISNQQTNTRSLSLNVASYAGNLIGVKLGDRSHFVYLIKKCRSKKASAFFIKHYSNCN